MNEQGSKKILFSKSSLLSLKAELLKKQEEVYEKKQLAENKVENFKPPPAKAPDKFEKTASRSGKKSFKDSLKSTDVEELEACRKSKLALEKKAELYEHLSDSSGSSQLAGRFLVDFSAKKQEAVCSEPVPKHNYKDEEDYDEKTQCDDGDDSEWVEFTDCLGRTRKCHKTDLVLYEQRDKELMRAMGINNNEAEQSSELDKQQSEKPFLVQKTNDYLQSLREKWEQKEKELLAKDKDIHYQDLLFDEARMHGVGYYSFSTNEAERQQQMEELVKRREETLKAQKEAEEKRRKREELVAARVAAARARQRARAGLPPEDPKEKSKDFATLLVELLNQKKNEVDATIIEKEKAIKEEKERERQKLREAYVREWDIGKEGLNENRKKFREMSQEEYVEQQRNKRIDEFAPPQISSYKNNYSFDENGKMLPSNSIATNKTWAEVRPKAKTPSPSIISEQENQLPSKGLYFSTTDMKRDMKYKNFLNANETDFKVNNFHSEQLNLGIPPPPKVSQIDNQSESTSNASPKEGYGSLKYKNFVRNEESTLIINELSDESSELQQDTNKVVFHINNTEIAPPPTYEYYGPLPKRSKVNKPFESDIREAYAQGAESLKSRSNVKKLSSLYDFTFD